MGLQLTLSKRSQVQANGSSSSNNKDEIQQPRASHIRKETRLTHTRTHAAHTHRQAHSWIWSIQSRFLLMSKLKQWPSGFAQNWAWQTHNPRGHWPRLATNLLFFRKRAYTFHVLSPSPRPTLPDTQNRLIDSPGNPLFGLVRLSQHNNLKLFESILSNIHTESVLSNVMKVSLPKI